MILALDFHESVPYVALLSGSLQSSKPVAYSARPPVASPSENITLHRNARMLHWLGEAMEASNHSANDAVLNNFSALLQILPKEFPPTEPYVSELGSICLDWDQNPDWQFSLLLKDNRHIAFAAYLSGEKVHGSARFSSAQLPSVLAQVTKRWISKRQPKGLDATQEETR